MTIIARRRRGWRGGVVVPVGTLLLFALVVGSLTWGEPIQRALRERWQPGPWALTESDLPAGAERLPVEPEWVSTVPPHEPAPWRLPGLRYLHSPDLVRRWMPVTGTPGVTAVSGVRHGSVSVYTSVIAHASWYPASHPVGDVYAGSLTERTWPEGVMEQAADAGVTLSSPQRIGEHALDDGDDLAPGWDDYTERAEDEKGYAGFTGIETDPSTGARQRVTVAMTAVSGAVVLVATLAPAHADVPAELEIDALVDRVATKIEAAPPQRH
ncbi:hypothetical protein GCM10009718_14560 [Isoptericola halotolerans]|uniref:Uncharacterized protein n=1 Tax=Isoptericola halotolerans TaxID=300560 RepID=A0ABX1ZYD7_9MICO|nr:hypothetical protein [Isoptericola halotolerans]NOV95622.1 hypothetical protein [Isoptericola halotolerans]